MDTGREPCPWLILADAGGAFSMGAIGATIWHGVKGARNSPAGERGVGAATAIKARAPVVAGNFAAFGGLLGLYTCAISGIRHREDPWNGIAAGLLTGGSLAVRNGYKAARNNAIGCAFLMAVFEGVGIAVQRAAAGSTRLY
ncbi:mitochondrial import inner membrane translocase subunit tim-17 [Colletotrichum incanum]|uniref:Mitochondrial import inner membrane translocase subunit tim-17 n=1 Tax=Colletotrichum incanum TaxID=1573173 RepID=A0A167BS62_COLIC|nr:mitochondrial import inner membrane translocase subunit tim-17 [Colletotrichum incanum]